MEKARRQARDGGSIPNNKILFIYGDVAKLVDALDLESSGEIRESSNLSIPTKQWKACASSEPFHEWGAFHQTRRVTSTQ
jgi:hypothetical protein